MSWMKTASTSALAAGAILLSAGCTSKKDVAIAAKDDTIRRQEQQIAYVETQRTSDQQSRLALEQSARQTAELNRQLADQNTQLADRGARQTAALIQTQNENTQKVAMMNQQVNELEGLVKGLNNKPATIVVNQPSAPGPVTNNNNDFHYHKDKEGSIHIQVAGSVLFEPGRADLKGSCHEQLMKIANTIRREYPNNAVRIEGHTDSTPVVHSKDRYPDNMALSQARAAAVFDFMSNRGGLSSGKMYTAGYGDRQPLASPERTSADRAKNRRVEIVILPNNLKVQKQQLAQNDQPRAFQASNPAKK